MLKLSRNQILWIVLAVGIVVVVVGVRTKWSFRRTSYLEGDADAKVEEEEFDDEEMTEEELKALEDEYGLEEDMFETDDEDEETDDEDDE